MRDLVRVLALAALPLLACAPDADSADPADAVSADEARALTDTFVSVHSDVRRCAAPLCGGFNVAWVNHTTTVCADGRSASQCYVASIDLTGTHLPDAQQSALIASLRDDAVASATVIRGHIVPGDAGAPGRFVATDVFRTNDPGASTASLVFANASTGCTFQPCAPSHMITANSTRARTAAVLDFSHAEGTDVERDLAQVGATSEMGVLVRGTLLAAQPNVQRAFRVSQYYLHVNAETPAPVCLDAVQAPIAATTDRLLFSSESDYPFDFFSHAFATRVSITASRVRTMLAVPTSTPVEIRTMDAFFSPWTTADANAPLADQTVSAHYRALRHALESNLTDLQVFRVGTIQIKVLVIGHDACGNVVGVSTTSIET